MLLNASHHRGRSMNRGILFRMKHNRPVLRSLTKSILSFMFCTMPVIAAAGTSVTGHVKDLSIQKDFGTFVFIQLDAQQTSPIACHVNLGWTYTLPQQTDTDKKILVMLMMARASGQTVTLRGAGGCNEFGAIESAIGIDTAQ